MQLVIGNKGEIGSAIQEVLGCDGVDINDGSTMPYDVLHICIPYSDRFLDIVNEYAVWYKPSLIVIHSTVPIGTTDQIENAVHSPVRGVHPNLVKGIQTFVKYFGGEKAEEAAKLFEDKGVKTQIVKDARTSEAIKLFDTTQYGLQIMIEKEIYKYCQDNNLDFEAVYRDANRTYNEGYIKLKKPEVVRPWLKQVDGTIGGHCVLPNLELFDWWLADLLKEQNNNY